MEINKNFDVSHFSTLDPEKVLELLQGSDDDINESIRTVRKSILEDKTLCLNDENVLGDMELLYAMIPENISPLEKIRWMYRGFGHLFSYDYRVAEDIKYGIEKVIDLKEYVPRYETCLQIAGVILPEYLNRFDNVECKVISRSLNNLRGQYGEDHVANEVIITNEDGTKEKYLLDLTLDLYLIQAGCRTEHFGYESGMNGDYDIIPQVDTYEIDKKLQLISDSEYTDEKIKDAKMEMKQMDFGNMSMDEILNYRIEKIESLSRMFTGYHEGKRYINKLFSELLGTSYKEFNLYSSKDSYINLKTCYLIEYGDYQKWVIYSNRLGFMKTDENGIKLLLDGGWKTKSSSLKEKIYGKENLIQNKTIG